VNHYEEFFLAERYQNKLIQVYLNSSEEEKEKLLKDFAKKYTDEV